MLIFVINRGLVADTGLDW